MPETNRQSNWIGEIKMKKLLLAVSMFLMLAAAHQSFAQRAAKEETVYAPAADSQEYKAIYAAVKNRHPKITGVPAVMRVQGIWARFAYIVEEVPEEEEVQSRGGKVSGPNVILKKTGGEWQIVYSFDPDNDDDDLAKKVKGVPQAVRNLANAKQKVAVPNKQREEK